MIRRFHAGSESWFPEAEELFGTSQSESQSVFPGACGFDDSPVVFFPDFANCGERVDESLSTTEGEEGEVGFGVAVSGLGGGDFEFLEAAYLFGALVILTDHFGKELNAILPVEASTQGVMESQR